MENNPNNKPASDIQEEGDKVTGGEQANQNQSGAESAPDTEGTEYTPQTETSKEEMTGYNELPEQEKVGGA